MPNAIQRCLLTLLLHFTFITTDVHKTFAAPVITDVSTTSSQVCAVISGSAWCMGNNSFGQLGNGTTTSTKVAVRVIRFDN
jgi:alpha-tubulin suppressor-like RCC1 family protein